jgi:hypothetical protein
MTSQLDSQQINQLQVIISNYITELNEKIEDSYLENTEREFYYDEKDMIIETLGILFPDEIG